MAAEKDTKIGSGQSLDGDRGADDGSAVAGGLEAKNRELLSETKRSKEEARALRAELEALRSTSQKITDELEAHRKEKMSAEERAAKEAKDAVAKAEALVLENERLRQESIRSQHVAIAARRGVVGDDVQEFVAGKVLSELSKNKELSIDAIYKELKSRNPAFFAASSAAEEEQEQVEEEEKPKAKKTSGGPASSGPQSSKAKLLAEFEAAKAAFEATPKSRRDPVLLHRMVTAKKRAGVES